MQSAVSPGTGNGFSVVWRADPDPLTNAYGGWAGYWLQGEKGRNGLGHSLNWGVTAVCEHLAFFKSRSLDIPLWRVGIDTFLTGLSDMVGCESLPTWLAGL